MHVFFRLCREWYKRFFTRWTLVFFFAAAVITFFCGDRGAAEYNRNIAESINFAIKEASIFKTIRSFDEYSNTGVGFYFSPGVESIFFNPPTIMYQLTAQINTIATFTVNDGLQRFRISGRPLFRFRFSAAVRILLSAFAIFMGFMPFHEREYLKFLIGRYSRAMVYISVFTTMLFVSLLGLFFMMAGATIGVVFRGISIARIDFLHLLVYIASVGLMLLFFCFTGAMAGIARLKSTAYIALSIVWFALIFIIPGIVDAAFEEKKSAVISEKESYDLKLQIINEFENMVKEKEGNYNRKEIERFIPLIEFYREKIFPMVEALDRRRRDATASEVSLYNNVRAFTVTGLYDTVSDGISGRGYTNYVEFLDFLLTKRREFVWFWIDQVYYKKAEKMASFVKGGESLFHPVNRGPGNLAFGFIFNILVLFVMNAVTYNRFKKYLHALETEETGQKENTPVNVAKGELKTLWIAKPRCVCDKLYNILSGQPAYNGKGDPIRITVDNVDLSTNRKKSDFLYLFHPRFFPRDMKVKDFVTFSLCGTGVSKSEKKAVYAALPPSISRGTFKNLDLDQRGEVLSAVLPYFKHRVYLVDSLDTASGMSMDFLFRLNHIMNRWAASGASVIHLTTGRIVELESKRPPAVDFDEHNQWSAMISHLERLHGKVKKSA